MMVGRLGFQLQQLLDCSAHDDIQRGLNGGRLGRNYAALRRGESSIFERRREEAGIDSAVMIAIDQSYSMGDSSQFASDAACMFVEALRRCPGVSYLVAGFSDSVEVSATTIGGEHQGRDRASWKVYKWWKEGAGAFLSRVSTLSLRRGGTPDTAALQDALKMVSAQPQERKLLIWIGDGCDYNVPAAKALLKRYSNVTVIGVGVMRDVSKVFDHSITVSSVSQLATASLSAVIRTLKK
jgi:cobalamin biosynthesis protein CobT